MKERKKERKGLQIFRYYVLITTRFRASNQVYIHLVFRKIWNLMIFIASSFQNNLILGITFVLVGGSVL